MRRSTGLSRNTAPGPERRRGSSTADRELQIPDRVGAKVRIRPGKPRRADTHGSAACGVGHEWSATAELPGSRTRQSSEPHAVVPNSGEFDYGPTPAWRPTRGQERSLSAVRSQMVGSLTPLPIPTAAARRPLSPLGTLPRGPRSEKAARVVRGLPGILRSAAIPDHVFSQPTR